MASMDLQNVGVHYLLPQAKTARLADRVKEMTLGGVIRRDHGRLGVAALENITFSLRRGDRLGLIGHNGAGKTTLLRVMAAILPPTSGRVRIVGRVSSLLSIGLGLNAESTGLDNIRNRARHMGCDEVEIDARFDEIAEFTELGDYLRLPMKTYSSGMRLRLAFAIATAFSPDILVLDEWLSAGDEAFQWKAQKRMRALVEQAGVVALASHNDELLKKLCTKGLVLQHGRAEFFGDIKQAFEVAEAMRARES